MLNLIVIQSTNFLSLSFWSTTNLLVTHMVRLILSDSKNSPVLFFFSHSLEVFTFDPKNKVYDLVFLKKKKKIIRKFQRDKKSDSRKV